MKSTLCMLNELWNQMNHLNRNIQNCGYYYTLRAWLLTCMCSWSCVRGRGWPAATLSCHSTKSCPVIASLTGCSTCVTNDHPIVPTMSAFMHSPVTFVHSFIRSFICSLVRSFIPSFIHSDQSFVLYSAIFSLINQSFCCFGCSVIWPLIKLSLTHEFPLKRSLTHSLSCGRAHLEASVHLHEEVIAAVGVHNKLHSASPLVPHS